MGRNAESGRRYTRRSRVAARTVRMGGGGGEEAMGDLGMRMMESAGRPACRIYRKIKKA